MIYLASEKTIFILNSPSNLRVAPYSFPSFDLNLSSLVDPFLMSCSAIFAVIVLPKATFHIVKLHPSLYALHPQALGVSFILPFLHWGQIIAPAGAAITNSLPTIFS